LAIEPSEGSNGAYDDAYIDIAHFTQSGRDQMAEEHAGRSAPPADEAFPTGL
jgi:hypothetical protein